MGLGVSATGWWRTVPILAESRPVIAFDNRGVGRSDRVPGPYSTPEMADDAIAVLDEAGFERAHVYGISLGGMIAQEIVLRHPDRVAGLVLGATTGGGPDAISPDEATLAFFRRRAEMPASEAVWASVPYSYGSTTRREHAQRIADDLEQRLRYPVEPEPYVAQLTAGLGHDAYGRLGEVDAPLVVHGDEDQLVPAANAELLAAAISRVEARALAGGLPHLPHRRARGRPLGGTLPRRGRRPPQLASWLKRQIPLRAPSRQRPGERCGSIGGKIASQLGKSSVSTDRRDVVARDSPPQPSGLRVRAKGRLSYERCCHCLSRPWRRTVAGPRPRLRGPTARAPEVPQDQGDVDPGASAAVLHAVCTRDKSGALVEHLDGPSASRD